LKIWGKHIKFYNKKTLKDIKMKKLTIIVVCVLLVSVFACSSTKNISNDVKTKSESVKKTDWSGIYVGILPCADCEGIKTRITLLKDDTYEKRTQYLGKEKVYSTESGTVDRSGDVLMLKAENGDEQKYQISDGFLLHLDKNGNAISGDLAENYKLMKNLTDADLENKKWVLTELKGQKIKEGKAPYLTFNSEKAVVSGNDGCNQFSGTYLLKKGFRLDIEGDKMISTMMYCSNMETANLFMEVLDVADNYAVADGVLSLNKARMAPLARFKLAGE
jgi:heat shock protein HslJ